jgi:hypothetical protein
LNDAEAIRATQGVGAKSIAEGPSLVLEAESRPPLSVIAALRMLKGEVLELRRDEAETPFRRRVAQRTPGFIGPDTCCWCGGVERAEDILLPFGVSPSGHAWLHSRCWCPWQESRAMARNWEEMIMGETEAATIDFFGGCPRCGGITGPCEVEYEHWGYCAVHKLKWALVGELRDADERSISESEVREAWRENERFLAGFEQLRGVPQGTWPPSGAEGHMPLARFALSRAFEGNRLTPIDRAATLVSAQVPDSLRLC